MTTFGELRRAKGFTQANLAKLLAVDQSTISLWEKGKTYPRTELALRVASLLGCTLDDLISAIRASSEKRDASAS